jgi:cupin fold WbuC family metalloprotein
MNENASNDSLQHPNTSVSVEAEFNMEKYRSVGTQEIVHLKKMALKSPQNRYRLCLHPDHKDPTQEMIICLKGFSYFHPHLHPDNRSESYHMIEGKLDIYLLDEKGALIDTVLLGAPNTVDSESRSLMYRLSNSIYHLTIPRSEWTIYHEVFTGPWSVTEAVHYAPFAPSNNEWGKVQAFVHQITGLTIEELIK